VSPEPPIQGSSTVESRFAPPPVPEQSPYAPPPSSTLPQTFNSSAAPPAAAPPAAASPAPEVSTPTPPITFDPRFAPQPDPPPSPAPPLETPIAVPAVAPPPQAPGLSWVATDVGAQTLYWTPSPTPPVPVPPESTPPWDRQRSPSPSADTLSDGGEPEIGSLTAESRTSRFIIGLTLGLVVALFTGVGVYVAGVATGGKPVAEASTAPSNSLRPFEATQKALNEAKFSGDLVPLAQPWLPYMGACLADTDIGGPKLLADETRHVFCRYGGVSVHFAQYKSETAVNLERNYREQLNLTTDNLQPGQQAPSQKTGGVSHVPGDYVEYALKGDDGRPLCGIWWDRGNSSGALFMEALCQEALGGSWAPLRDLWQRFS
jgi:hypothetical protein